MLWIKPAQSGSIQVESLTAQNRLRLDHQSQVEQLGVFGFTFTPDVDLNGLIQSASVNALTHGTALTFPPLHPFYEPRTLLLSKAFDANYSWNVIIESWPGPQSHSCCGGLVTNHQ